MRRAAYPAVILLAFASLLGGCDDDAATEPGARFDLTFTGDAIPFLDAPGQEGAHEASTVRSSGLFLCSPITAGLTGRSGWKGSTLYSLGRRSLGRSIGTRSRYAA